MAAADIRGTNILVGQRVEVQSGAHFMKRPKVTAVGSGTVTLSMSIGAGIAGTILKVLGHHDQGPTTAMDWSSQQ